MKTPKDRLERLTCRDARKDTVAILRSEIDELITELREERRQRDYAEQAFQRMQLINMNLVRTISSAIELACSNPVTEPSLREEDVPF